MKQGEVQFKYELLDAWGSRLYTIKMKLSAKNQVYYRKIGEKRQELLLQPELSEKLRELLQDPSLYGFERLETEAEEFLMMDGTISDITYSDGTLTQELYVCNLSNYRIDQQKWPHAAAVRELLLAVKDILERAGVPAAFFAEGWE